MKHNILRIWICLISDTDDDTASSTHQKRPLTKASNENEKQRVEIESKENARKNSYVAVSFLILQRMKKSLGVGLSCPKNNDLETLMRGCHPTLFKVYRDSFGKNKMDKVENTLTALSSGLKLDDGKSFLENILNLERGLLRSARRAKKS
jgi:hypothetical protein